MTAPRRHRRFAAWRNLALSFFIAATGCNTDKQTAQRAADFNKSLHAAVKTDTTHLHPRVASLRESFRQTPLGDSLIRFIDTRGIDIRMDSTIRAAWAGSYSGLFGTGNSISLNPRMNDSTLIGTIAHEIRHAWQNELMTQIAVPARALLPPDLTVAMMNYIEADAFAFTHYFMADRQHKLGIQPVYKVYHSKSAFDLHAQMQDGRSPDPQLFRDIFRRSFSALGEHYAGAHLGRAVRAQTRRDSLLQDHMTQAARDLAAGDTAQAQARIYAIAHVLHGPHIAKKVKDFLRHLGGTNFNPTQKPLRHLTDRELIQDYPRGHRAIFADSARTAVLQQLTAADQSGKRRLDNTRHRLTRRR